MRSRPTPRAGVSYSESGGFLLRERGLEALFRPPSTPRADGDKCRRHCRLLRERGFREKFRRLLARREFGRDRFRLGSGEDAFAHDCDLSVGRGDDDLVEHGIAWMLEDFKLADRLLIFAIASDALKAFESLADSPAKRGRSFALARFVSVDEDMSIQSEARSVEKRSRSPSVSSVDLVETIVPKPSLGPPRANSDSEFPFPFLFLCVEREETFRNDRETSLRLEKIPKVGIDKPSPARRRSVARYKRASMNDRHIFDDDFFSVFD